MNLPFSLPNVKDYNDKRYSLGGTAAHLEKKRAEYNNAMENYKKNMDEYMEKIESNQSTHDQMILDLTSLKEQGKKIAGYLEEIKAFSLDKEHLSIMDGLTSTISEINIKLDGLNKDVVNQISNLIAETQKQYVFVLNQQYLDNISEIQRMTNIIKSLRRRNAVMLIMMLLNLAGLSTLIYLFLYVERLLPF